MRIALNLDVIGPFSDIQLYEFCMANKDLRIERDAQGQLFIMSPTGTETSFYNYDIGFELGIWNRKYKLGKISESTGGYLLPDGSMRAPDIAWVSNSQLKSLSNEDSKGFMKLCPDFVIDLMSEHDNFVESNKKMKAWMLNGVRLAWLISPQESMTYIYHINQESSIQDFNIPLSGLDVLPDFQLDLSKIFAGK